MKKIFRNLAKVVVLCTVIFCLSFSLITLPANAAKQEAKSSQTSAPKQSSKVTVTKKSQKKETVTAAPQPPVFLPEVKVQLDEPVINGPGTYTPITKGGSRS